MSKKLESLLAVAAKYKMSAKEREAQRLSFAYGNTRIENDRITKDTVQQAANKLKTAADEKDT